MIPNIHVPIHTQYTEMSSIWYQIRLALVFIHILIFDEVKIMYSVSFTCCLIFDPYYYYVVLVLYVSCLFILNTFFYSLIYLHQSFVCVFRKMFVIKKGKYGWFYMKWKIGCVYPKNLFMSFYSAVDSIKKFILDENG